MRLRYQCTKLLNARATGAVYRSLPVIRKIRRLARWAVVVGLAALLFGQTQLGRALLMGGFFFIVFFRLFGFLTGLTRSLGSRLVEHEHELVLTPEALIGEGGLARTRIAWEAITEVRLEKRFIVLLTGRWNGMAIPRKRLDDVPDDSLVEWIESRAGSPAPSPTSPGGGPMTGREDEVVVSFIPTVELLMAATRAVMWRSGASVLNILLLGGMWAYFGLLPWIRAMANPGGSAVVRGILAVLLGTAFVALFFLEPRLNARRALASPLSRGRLQEVGISPEGVRTRGPIAECEIGWEAVRRSRETERFFLVFFSRSSAFYIPKAEFDDSTMDRLRRLLSEHSEFRPT
ncbi:MAG: YcxB family protein [Gemmatimonadota bacterium]|nr:YcxB family protein [Gemmatimonadota bacterium]